MLHLAGGSGDDKAVVEPVAGNNSYHPGTADAEYDELHVRCPPHTTDNKWKAQARA